MKLTLHDINDRYNLIKVVDGWKVSTFAIKYEMDMYFTTLAFKSAFFGERVHAYFPEKEKVVHMWDLWIINNATMDVNFNEN